MTTRSFERWLERLAALSVRVVKPRPPATPELDPETRVAIERSFEPGGAGDLYFPDALPDPQFDRFSRSMWALMLRAMGEQPFAPAGSGARATYRLVRAPSFRFRSVVRITRRDAGWEITGRVFAPEEAFTPKPALWERTRLLSDTEGARLEQLLQGLRFWAMPVTVRRDGLDGESWLLEGAEGSRYHLVDRWQPEEESLVAFGEYLGTASGVDQYRPEPPGPWLRWTIARIEAAQDRERVAEEKAYRESVDRSNEVSSRLAAELAEKGLTCPHCGTHSSDMRYFDKRPDSRSYFVCKACGRSFYPESPRRLGD